MNFTMYLSDQRGNERNKLYPHRFTVNSVGDLVAAAQFDHVCAQYRDNLRGNDRFLCADVLPLDLDNSHSDDPTAWKTLDDLQAAFPGVAFYSVESRNHMKPKAGKAPRPKYHVYFPIHPITDAAACADLKRRVITVFPWFDRAAADAGRFLFGVENPQVHLIEGAGRRIDEYLVLFGPAPATRSESGSAELHTRKDDNQPFALPEVIACGERNTVLFKYACQLRARGLNVAETRILLEMANERCETPVELAEIEAILKSAMRYDVSPAALERATTMLTFMDVAAAAKAAASVAGVDQTGIVCLEDMVEKAPQWLIPGYIPRQEITVMAGDGGTGKTFCWTAIAAAVSSGNKCFLLNNMAPGDPVPPQKVMYFSSEDSNEAVLRPRLRASGALLENIITIDSKHDMFSSVKINSSFLESLLDRYRPALCVFDPLQSFLPRGTSMIARNDMREAMGKLHIYGEKYGTTFLIIMHTNKKSDTWGRKRLADSADIWDIARSVLVVGKVGEDGPNTRYCSQEKSSYGKEQQIVLFRIAGNAVEFASYTEKKDRDFILAAARNGRPAPARDAAEEFIIEYLEEHGECPIRVLDDAAKNSLIAGKTLRSAKERLKEQGKITMRQAGNGSGKGVAWYISLQDNAP